MVQFGFKIPHILRVICPMLAAAIADKAKWTTRFLAQSIRRAEY
jgi:hypothetical protein